jgi:hypothetical protein
MAQTITPNSKMSSCILTKASNITANGVKLEAMVGFLKTRPSHQAFTPFHGITQRINAPLNSRVEQHGSKLKLTAPPQALSLPGSLRMAVKTYPGRIARYPTIRSLNRDSSAVLY